MRAERILRAFAAAWLVVAPTALLAQSDRAAGLFTEARQLPLISQGLTLEIAAGEARLRIVQLFWNDGADVGQADYRLHLPEGATVVGFGFWSAGEFFEAELRPREEAERRHDRAATEGRATTLLREQEGIHAFSVYPLAAGERKKVETELLVPVERELGRYCVNLAVDRLVGPSAPATSVLIDLESEEAVADWSVSSGVPQVVESGARTLRLVLATRESVELCWTEQGPPLLFRAEGVPLDDGSIGLRVRAAFNDAGEARPAFDRLHLLLDGSYSMRRRAAALGTLLERVGSAADVEVRYTVVAERAAGYAEAGAALAALRNGSHGHRADGSRLAAELDRLGCGASVRCAVVTDPQLEGLGELAPGGAALLLFADVHERAHFADRWPAEAMVHLPGVDGAAHLLSWVDRLVRPVLAIHSLTQDGVALEPLARQALEVAEGGVLRLYATVDRDTDVELRGAIDGYPVAAVVRVEMQDPAGPEGVALRRALFRELLAKWMERYRREPEARLRDEIVALSLREGIPTAFTALQVDDPRLRGSDLPRTATPAAALLLAGLSALLLSAALALAARRATPADRP